MKLLRYGGGPLGEGLCKWGVNWGGKCVIRGSGAPSAQILGEGSRGAIFILFETTN